MSTPSKQSAGKSGKSSAEHAADLDPDTPVDATAGDLKPDVEIVDNPEAVAADTAADTDPTATPTGPAVPPPDMPAEDEPENPDSIWQGIVAHPDGHTTIATYETRAEAEEWADQFVEDLEDSTDVSATIAEIPPAETLEPTVEATTTSKTASDDDDKSSERG